ncbi:MAG TPA: DUF1178 family protein [Hyphomonas sp.]|nr:DUF1178 family protein [Hyphomonas sp.]MCB9963056.1 DUF1178 family protein [Hyphomonas sp.]MCB9972447.1 DUF1178 family protein [Hyphomonas sp.]MCC0017706.1 DUF1178 family protein [Rhodobiaceae bacterium]HPE47837.1 DUF1178 family protein [Hyphomonas sp.]
MIRYALHCKACEAEFEAWFASSTAYDGQKAKRLVRCVDCGSSRVEKQIMAPAVKGTRASNEPPVPEKLMQEFAARARQHVAENFDYVGDSFADEARSMYYGEQDDRPIWGETTAEEREALKEEGVPAAPLPPAFTPPVPKPKGPVN